MTAPTVLLADDHGAIRAGLRIMLEAQGITVVGEAADGDVAVRNAAALRPDVVLMDLRMPVMDGLDAIRAIRKAEAPGLPRAPIIVISANTSPDDLRASDAAGADRHIGKPIRAEALFDAISGVLA